VLQKTRDLVKQDPITGLLFKCFGIKYERGLEPPLLQAFPRLLHRPI
jgi:hypothetical protein